MPIKNQPKAILSAIVEISRSISVKTQAKSFHLAKKRGSDHVRYNLGCEKLQSAIKPMSHPEIVDMPLNSMAGPDTFLLIGIHLPRIE